jgi:hypothetical protein
MSPTGTNMSSLTDRVAAAPGWLASVVRRTLGGSRRAVWIVIVILVLMTLIPTIAIGSSQRPTDLTFDDVRRQDIPAATTWVRLDGVLAEIETASGSAFHLFDPADEAHFIVVTALEPLEPGRVVMTGHLTLGAQGSDIIGFLDADVPAVPRRDEPFQLILLPAAIAIVLAIGMQLGYPVVRRDGRAPVAAPTTAAGGAAISAAWSGRIGRDLVPADHPIRCTVSLDPVADHPDLADVSVSTGERSWTVRIRRAAPTRPIRLCRLGSSTPGLEIHASTADLVLAFADRATRDRLPRLLR